MEKRVEIVKGSTNHATALTHAERRALINKPFPKVRLLGKSYPWGGVQIVRELPGGTKRNTGRDEPNTADVVSLEDLVALAEK